MRDAAQGIAVAAPCGMAVSIVSHGHGAQVARLLGQLGTLPPGVLSTVVLTLNVPALDEGIVLADAALVAKLRLQVLRNAAPLGFGANHNQAYQRCFGAHFAHSDRTFFCVMNPDIELPDALVVMSAVGRAFVQPRTEPEPLGAVEVVGVGLAYPVQVNALGQRLDFERALATPQAIAQRQLDNVRTVWRGGWSRGNREKGGAADMASGSRALAEYSGPVDWVNGALMVFKSEVFGILQGFDERYFMYCEDVDMCLRLQLAGYTLARADACVVHHTHRRTLKNVRHLGWHVRSLLRLWSSDAYKRYQQRLKLRP